MKRVTEIRLRLGAHEGKQVERVSVQESGRTCRCRSHGGLTPASDSGAGTALEGGGDTNRVEGLQWVLWSRGTEQIRGGLPRGGRHAQPQGHGIHQPGRAMPLLGH